jgi:HTH-type transcriptional regulator, sugar sensing transcriptional regulator
MNDGTAVATVESRASELLQLYGLSEREALVYLLVLRSGSVSAGDIAKSLSLRRMEAYRLVKKLSDANMIRANAGKPVTYSAESAEDVVSTMMEAHHQKTKAMEVAKEEFLVLVRSMPRGRPRPSEQQFKIIQGREQIYGKIGRMVDDSKESLGLFLTRNDLVQAFQLGIIDRLTRAATRGVKVRVLSQIDDSTLEAAEALQKKCEVKHSADAVAGRLVLQDKLAALSSLVLDDSQGRRNDQDIAVSSESPNYAEMLVSLFDVAYKSAAPSAERMAVVKEDRLSGDKIKSLTDVLAVTLPEEGWEVRAPGIITGKSGASYAYPVVAKKAKHTLAVDVVAAKKEQDANDRAVQSIMKKLDLEGVELVVASTPSSSDDVKKLAELMGVGLVSGPDTLATVGELRKLLRSRA